MPLLLDAVSLPLLVPAPVVAFVPFPAVCVGALAAPLLLVLPGLDVGGLPLELANELPPPEDEPPALEYELAGAGAAWFSARHG